MEGWKDQPLGEVCQFINRGISPAYLEAGGVAVLNQKCVRDHTVNFDLGRRHDPEAKKVSPERYVRAGDVLVNSTGTGTLGRVAQLREAPPEPTTVDSHVTIVRAKDGLFYPEFFGYALVSIEEQIQEGGEGCGGQTELSRSKLAGGYRIAFPTERNEQRRLVAILDEAFEAIAMASANTEKNLQRARELPALVMRSSLATGSDSWTESTIGEQVTLQRGFDITKDLQRDGLVPVVSSGGIRSYHDTHMVRAPGVVMGRKGTLGKVFFLEEDFWPHDTTLWVKDFKGNDPRFVYRFFAVLEVKGLDSGAANPALNRNQVHALRVLWPPLDEQVALAERIAGISIGADQLASTYAVKLAALDELKKSMLHQAFTGRLTDKSSDQQLKAVA